MNFSELVERSRKQRSKPNLEIPENCRYKFVEIIMILLFYFDIYVVILYLLWYYLF